MFSRPTNADRDRRRADLLQRAELVRTYGWEDCRAVWSAGEIAGVAALLGDHDVLGELDERPIAYRMIGAAQRWC
jgi:hypothetical protein